MGERVSWAREYEVENSSRKTNDLTSQRCIADLSNSRLRLSARMANPRTLSRKRRCALFFRFLVGGLFGRFFAAIRSRAARLHVNRRQHGQAFDNLFPRFFIPQSGEQLRIELLGFVEHQLILFDVADLHGTAPLDVSYRFPA